MNHALLDRLFLALAAGDSLGSTSEFVRQADVPALYRHLQARGWPFRQVGGGQFAWPVGAPTDDTDMALCMVRSAIRRNGFDGEDVAERFIAWLETGPRDVGATTRATLSNVRGGQPWHVGALADFSFNPANAANGSLMRNGVVSGIANDLDDAFRITVLHSVITHFAPLPVLCCAAHTYLIFRCLESPKVLDGNWKDAFVVAFEGFLRGAADPHVRKWRALVDDHYSEALNALLKEDFDPDSFNPFSNSFTRRAGYCLLTLQIAVWAAAWAARNVPFPTPPNFPSEPFLRTAGWTISWVAMIGHDSDTYGAAAGPLIEAVAGIPAELKQSLLVAAEFQH